MWALGTRVEARHRLLGAAASHLFSRSFLEPPDHDGRRTPLVLVQADPAERARTGLPAGTPVLLVEVGPVLVAGIDGDRET